VEIVIRAVDRALLPQSRIEIRRNLFSCEGGLLRIVKILLTQLVADLHETNGREQLR
jgi:hypothetical protein